MYRDVIGNQSLIFPKSQQIFKEIAWNPIKLNQSIKTIQGGHGGRVVTLPPPTSEAGVRFPARPQVGKLVVA